MSETLSRALVLTLLQHAEDFPWRMQEIGLMSLRLDDRREHRLQSGTDILRRGTADPRPPV